MPTQEQLLQLIGAQYIDVLTLQKRVAELEKEIAELKAKP